MIQIKNLSAGYFGKPVIEKVTMEFQPGKVTVLTGPNGSGKSTLLKAALGLLPAIEGEVLYGETDIRLLKRRQIARKAAFLTQSRNTPSIRALQMVLHGRFPYLSYPRYYGREDYEIARGAMDTTGSRQHENTNITQLSGGQRQGVYLAMALAQDTRTIFMDEPTTYLDISHQFRLMETAKSLAREGKAVVLVLHDISLALREADVIAVFQDGRLLCCDTPEIVYQKGVMEEVFGVGIHRMDTPHGIQYYCTPKEV
ncbi:ABC transporter ATP-binding protein [bacterium 1xD8-48]|nr:ABC transporter ATP-binding protein [Lachnospiraceae bacterium]NBK00384.1 ABC transporter ATP-binding protein [bacterium 1xD8-48]